MFKKIWDCIYVPTLCGLVFLCGAAFTYSIQAKAVDEKGSMIKCSGYQCVIDIGDSMEGPDEYADVVTLLGNLSSDYTVTFKLHGNGGRVDGAVAIISAIERTKVHVEGEVTGSVYSAHAFLTASMPHVKWSCFGVFMLHASSSTNEEDAICQGITGTDRGVSALAKCKEDAAAETKIYNEYLMRKASKIMTSEEIQHMFNGYDVYLSSEEAEKRLNKGNG